MLPDPPTIPIPPSYESLPVRDIALSHYPAHSPTATPVIILTLNRPKNANAFTLQMDAGFRIGISDVRFG